MFMMSNNDSDDKLKNAEAILDELAKLVLGPCPYASADTLIKENLYTLQNRLSTSSNTEASVVLQATVQLLEQNPEYLKGQSSYALHNLAMEAQRRGLHGVALHLLEAGRKIFPDDVDINCDLLQLYYLHYPNKYKAEEIWNVLQQLDPSIRDRKWRYWNYGALYYYRIHNRIEEAKKLLQEGIRKVVPEDRHLVLNSLATVCADWDPQPNLEKVIEILEEGLSEGLELGYEVARKIGELKQRLAGRASTAEERQQYLEEALDWLNTAEALFTNDIQHPIIKIYRARVNVLMGLRRYGKAIDDIAAILAQDIAAINEGSLIAQLRLACERNGETERYRDILKELSQRHQSETANSALPIHSLVKMQSQQPKGEPEGEMAQARLSETSRKTGFANGRADGM